MLNQSLPGVSPPSPDAWPHRLLGLPVSALDLSPQLVNHLGATGFLHLSSLVGLSADQLSRQAGLSLQAAERILYACSEIVEGVCDPTSCTACTLEEELAEILARTRARDPDRAQFILERLYGLTGTAAATLEAIGAELGITRERVRQIRSKVEDDLGPVLRWYHAHSLATARSCVFNRGGAVSLADLASAVAERLSPGRYDPEAYARWIVQQANDPTLLLVLGDVVVGPPLGLLGMRKVMGVIERALSERMPVTAESGAERIRAEMEGPSAVNAMHHSALLLPRLGHQIAPGQYSATSWTRADWAEHVLTEAGSPLHYSAISARVQQITGMGANDLGFNSVLNSDKRFVRVGAGDFVLASSGIQRYGRFDEVIERYLQTADLPVHEDQIADDLLRSYTVTRSTVSAMLRINDRCFTHFGGGYWGLTGIQYRCDPLLERDVVACLNVHPDGLAVSQIRQWLLERTHGAFCPSLATLELALYLCPKVRRVGNTSPAQFRVLAQPASTAIEPIRDLWDQARADREEPSSDHSMSRLKALADLL